MASDAEYMKKYMLERYHRRKQAAIASLGGKCVVCGGVEALQFDHIDPSQKAWTIAKSLVSISEKKLQEELKKCQLLCPECHNRKTLNQCGRKNAKGTHGTLSAARYCKAPRCGLCKAACNAAARRRKEKADLP